MSRRPPRSTPTYPLFPYPTPFRSLDILVNNAGAGGARDPIDTITAEDWDRTQALLLRSVAMGIRHAAPLMAARGGGAIVNTSSVSALGSGYAPTAYSTAKAGVLHLTKMAAADLARHHIRVNADRKSTRLNSSH